MRKASMIIFSDWSSYIYEINGEYMFLCVSVASPMHTVEVCSSSKLVQLQEDAAISHGEW